MQKQKKQMIVLVILLILLILAYIGVHFYSKKQEEKENAKEDVKRRAKREKSFCKEMQYLYGFEPLLTKGLKREKYAC